MLDTMTNKVRLFVGTSENHDTTIEKIYLYSILKNTNAKVEVTWLRPSMFPNWRREGWGTPFTCFRYAIPELCNFKGRALYTDCDMINFKDINELLNIDMEGKPIAARRGTRFGGHEFCVMVFDCEKFENYSMPMRRMKSIPESHHRMINKFSGSSLVHDLDPKWNCLDGEWLPIEDIWHLHYTKMESQPWKPAWFTGAPVEHARPEIAQLWFDMKQEALNAGYRESDYIPEEKFGSYNIIGR